MATTSIEWTAILKPDGKLEAGKSWNPVTGCSPVSPGCEHCYAQRFAFRLRGRAGYPADDPFAVTLHPDRLDEPLKWRRPARIFTCSMGDLFHAQVPDAFLDKVMAVMEQAHHHTFLILTKRVRRMARYFQSRKRVPPNVWLGTSAEDQDHFDLRVPALVSIPARVHFVSLEPLLGPIDLSHHLAEIEWVIAGAESGPGARPMDEQWVRSIRDQCQKAQVPFFYKQANVNGRKAPLPELDGQVWAQSPCS